jgi:hypothetical protein
MAMFILRVLLWMAALTGAACAGERSEQQIQIEARIEALMPLVEQVTDRRFHRTPPVVLANPDTIAAVLYEEQVHLLRRLAGMDEAQARVAARRTSIENAAAFVGKYGFIDKKLYVMQDGIVATVINNGIPIRLIEPVTDLVLAHELVHALQDQHTDLARLVANRPTADAVVAVNCAVEGHAVWVHEQVGGLLGVPEAVHVVSNMLGYDLGHPEISPDPRLFYTSYVYGQGRNFIALHHELDGNEGVWRLLSNPPATSSMIVLHDPYDTVPAHRWNRRVRRAVASARHRIAAKGWLPPIDESVGDYDMRERLANSGLDFALADAFASGWTSRSASAPSEWVEVQLLRFETAGHATLYVDQMKSQARLDLARAMPPVTSVRLTPSVDGTVEDFQPLAYNDSGEERVRIEMGFGTSSQEFRQVWVARGQHVVQIVLANHEVGDRKVARSIRRVFRSVREEQVR